MKNLLYNIFVTPWLLIPVKIADYIKPHAEIGETVFMIMMLLLLEFAVVIGVTSFIIMML